MVAETEMEEHMRIICLPVLLLMAQVSAAADLYVIIIRGLEGSPVYATQFSHQLEKLLGAAETVTDKDHISVLSGDDATREKILAEFTRLRSILTPQDRIAVFMVGHGSYDGFEYKFNIPGLDLTGEDLLAALDSQPPGIQLVVNTGSASGALLELLKADTRTVITATRSGSERLATRFGTYFTDAFTDPAADINKNRTVTVAEAFAYAERKVADFYETEGRLMTEHPLIQGEAGRQVVIARAAAQTRVEDSRLAALFAERDQLDRRIETLQLEKNALDADVYMDRLQLLLLELSLLQQEIDQYHQEDSP